MRGFTIIELLVTITISSIILSTAVPGLINLNENHRSSSSVAQLRTIFTSARNLALSNNKRITACPISNQACSNDWKKPIAIFFDQNNNERIDEGDIHVLTASNESSSGDWLVRNAETKSIHFNERGHAFGSATTFLYCPHSGRNQHARQLIISFQGRIRSDYYLSNRGTPYASLGSFICPTI